MLQDMFTFAGRWNRLNRQRFFGYGILQAVMAMVMFGIVGVITRSLMMGGESSLILIYVLSGAIYALAVWMNLCLSVKRLHDLDKSAWYFLVYLVPVVNLFFVFYLWFAKGIEGDNQYGPDPLAQA